MSMPIVSDACVVFGALTPSVIKRWGRQSKGSGLVDYQGPGRSDELADMHINLLS